MSALRESEAFIPELSLVAVEDESFMAICLSENAERRNGTMEYDKAFLLRCPLDRRFSG